MFGNMRGSFLIERLYNICYILFVMTNVLTITTIGNSIGVILPKDVLAKLRVSKGDKVYLTETASGIELTSYDEEFAEQMEAAEKVMREDRDVLRLLAK